MVGDRVIGDSKMSEERIPVAVLPEPEPTRKNGRPASSEPIADRMESCRRHYQVGIPNERIAIIHNVPISTLRAWIKDRGWANERAAAAEERFDEFKEANQRKLGEIDLAHFDTSAKLIKLIDRCAQMELDRVEPTAEGVGPAQPRPSTISALAQSLATCQKIQRTAAGMDVQGRESAVTEILLPDFGEILTKIVDHKDEMGKLVDPSQIEDPTQTLDIKTS